MSKKDSSKKEKVMYSCKSCGNVSTKKGRVCVPEKISSIQMK